MPFYKSAALSSADADAMRGRLQASVNRLIHGSVASPAGRWLMQHGMIAPTQRRFHRSLAEPIAAQRQIFAYLLRRGAHTVFGRDHRLRPGLTLGDLQARVPVRRYEALKPYVDRAIAGERDLLWPGHTHWFLESSGTSGDKKQIPLTLEGWTTAYQATAQTYVAMLAARVGVRQFLQGKTLFFVGNVRPDAADRRRIFGDVTGFGVYLMPWYLQFARAPDKATTLLPNWEERLHRIAAATLNEPIVHLAGLPTWLRAFGEIVLTLTGKRTLREIWPCLRVATLGGVNPALYQRELCHLILGQPDTAGSDFFFSEVYNGTEGFYAMQIDAGDMVLMPAAQIFYEFVPRAHAEQGDFSRAVPLDAVEVGVDYAPVISTVSGLWRYLIGDTVRFTATHPYRLQVSGRVSQYLNIAGEELLMDSCDRALQTICTAQDYHLVDYMVVALKLDTIGQNALHLWLVEVADGEVDPNRFAHSLDAELRAQHYDYAKARAAGNRTGASLGLAAPVVMALPPGSFYRWLARRLGGQISAQSKVPRLTHDLALAVGLLTELPNADESVAGEIFRVMSSA